MNPPSDSQASPEAGPHSADQRGDKIARRPTGWGRRMGRALRLLALPAVLTATWFSAGRIGVRDLGVALAAARPLPLLAAVALAICSALAKSAYWSVALPPRATMAVWASFRLTLASVVASALAPRGGDVLKIWQLRRQLRVPMAYLLAVSGLEKIGDTLCLLLLTCPLPWVLPQLPRSALAALAALPIGLGLTLALLLVLAKAPRLQAVGWLAGVALLRDGRRLPLAFACVLLAWLCDFAELLLVLGAVGAPVGLGGAMLMLLFVNLANAVPLTPGNVGAQELGSVVALTLAGASRPAALAAGLLFHATQTLPLLLAGLIDVRALLAGKLRLGAPAADSAAAVAGK